MDKLSEGITSAFNTAGTEANKAKLQTEIAMKQHQIKGIKQEFGVRGQRMKSNGRRGAPAPPAVAAPRARRVSEPSLLNHGLTGRGVGPHGARRHRGPPGVIQAKAGDRAERHRRPRQAPATARRPGRAQADARRVRDRAGRSHAVPKSNFSVPHLHPTHWLISTQAPRKASPSRRRPPTARRSGSRCPRGLRPARRCMYACPWRCRRPSTRPCRSRKALPS